VRTLRACQSAPSLATLCAEEALAAPRRSMRNRAAAPGTPPLPLEDGVRLEACPGCCVFWPALRAAFDGRTGVRRLALVDGRVRGVPQAGSSEVRPEPFACA